MKFIEFDTITNHLSNTFKELISTINNPVLLSLLSSENIYFAGGCIRSLACCEPINDYDMYFTTSENANKFRSLLLAGNSILVDSKKFDILAETDNALTCQIYKNKKIQFITKYAGPPERLINNFDWTNSMGYYIPASFNNKKVGFLHISSAMKESMEEKKLIFNQKMLEPMEFSKKNGKIY